MNRTNAQRNFSGKCLPRLFSTKQIPIDSFLPAVGNPKSRASCLTWDLNIPPRGKTVCFCFHPNVERAKKSAHQHVGT